MSLQLRHLSSLFAGPGFAMHPLHEGIQEFGESAASLQVVIELDALLLVETVAVRIGRFCSLPGDGIWLDAIQRQVGQKEAHEEE